MTDDDLRDVLAQVATPTFDTPHGFVRAPEAHVVAHGADADEARSWVERHGGRVVRDLSAKPSTMGGGLWQQPRSEPRVVYEIPEAALTQPDSR